MPRNAPEPPSSRDRATVSCELAAESAGRELLVWPNPENALCPSKAESVIETVLCNALTGCPWRSVQSCTET